MHAIFRTKRAHDVRIKGGARACMPASGLPTCRPRNLGQRFRSLLPRVRHGHVGVVDLLMTEAPHLTEDGTSPLYLAAMAGSAQISSFRLEF
jgi:hypothetical protein